MTGFCPQVGRSMVALRLVFQLCHCSANQQSQGALMLYIKMVSYVPLPNIVIAAEHISFCRGGCYSGSINGTLLSVSRISVCQIQGL